MRRVMLGLLACGLLAAACDEQSRVDPNATIRIEGTVRAPDGAPLADRPVRLGSGVGTGDGLFAVLTLGLACTSGSCSGKVFDTTTDSAGVYTLELKGRDTQSSFGEAVSELLSVSAAPAGEQVSGALVSARFKVQTEKIAVPTLELVDPGLTVQAAGADVQRNGRAPSPDRSHWRSRPGARCRSGR